MKKRSHTLAVILNFFFVLAFFGSSSTNKIHGSRPQSPQNFFFPFLFFRPHKIILRTLSLSLSLCFLLSRHKKKHAPSRGREREEEEGRNARREFTTRSTFSSFKRSSCSLCAGISYVFFIAKTRQQKPERKKKVR
jgi:hypothetical protein